MKKPQVGQSVQYFAQGTMFNGPYAGQIIEVFSGTNVSLVVHIPGHSWQEKWSVNHKSVRKDDAEYWQALDEENDTSHIEVNTGFKLDK